MKLYDNIYIDAKFYSVLLILLPKKYMWKFLTDCFYDGELLLADKSPEFHQANGLRVLHTLFCNSPEYKYEDHVGMPAFFRTKHAGGSLSEK